MKCPKCGTEQADQNSICGECGIVFEKFWKYHEATDSGEVVRRRSRVKLQVDKKDGLGSLLLGPATAPDPVVAWARAGLLAGLTLWGLWFMTRSVQSNAVGESFLHMVNLPFHEFGHILFRPFGAFVTSLGGTLGQLLMPLICGLVLLIQTKDPFGASVALWWFGQNFMDIAPYINDARAGELPLVGGNYGHSSPYGFHDWEYLLTESGMLRWDHALATLSHATGVLIMLVALCWGALLVHRQLRGRSQRFL